MVFSEQRNAIFAFSNLLNNRRSPINSHKIFINPGRNKKMKINSCEKTRSNMIQCFIKSHRVGDEDKRHVIACLVHIRRMEIWSRRSKTFLPSPFKTGNSYVIAKSRPVDRFRCCCCKLSNKSNLRISMLQLR